MEGVYKNWKGGGGVMKLTELPPASFWEVVSALRGPDYSFAIDVKWVFTARIRYWVKQIFGLETVRYGTRSRPLSAADVENAAAQAKEAVQANAFLHYRDHVLSALFVLVGFLNGEDRRECHFLIRLCSLPPKEWAKEYKAYLREGDWS
jgi:hypothetical protein